MHQKIAFFHIFLLFRSRSTPEEVTSKKTGVFSHNRSFGVEEVNSNLLELLGFPENTHTFFHVVFSLLFRSRSAAKVIASKQSRIFNNHGALWMHKVHSLALQGLDFLQDTSTFFMIFFHFRSRSSIKIAPGRSESVHFHGGFRVKEEVSNFLEVLRIAQDTHSFFPFLIFFLFIIGFFIR